MSDTHFQDIEYFFRGKTRIAKVQIVYVLGIPIYWWFKFKDAHRYFKKQNDGWLFSGMPIDEDLKAALILAIEKHIEKLNAENQ